MEMDKWLESLEAASVCVAGALLFVWSLCETERLGRGE